MHCIRNCVKMIRLGNIINKWCYHRIKIFARTYQHYVMNETLAQLEAACERYCPFPRVPGRRVTVLGAGSDVGRIVSLLLKQQPIVRTLAMYDDHPCNNVLGAACDISHIDTSPLVEAYQGRKYLRSALGDADVVLICGGHTILPPCCDTPDRELFLKNLSFVRSMTLATSKFAPHAIIVIQTVPVEANYTLVKYTLKEMRNFDPRKVLGVNSINCMRANQLLALRLNLNPSTLSIPVVGGTGRCTRVPVFSIHGQPCDANLPLELTQLVRDADGLVCRIKCNNEHAHLSIGFSTARCIVNIMKGIFEKPTVIDSAFVQQAHPDKCYNMKYCSTPVTIGPNGITKYSVPKLSELEDCLLESSKCDLLDLAHLGKCYGLGDEYIMHECQWYCCPAPAPPCKVTPTTERKLSEREKCDNFRTY